MKSEFLKLLEKRSLIYQATDIKNLDNHLLQKRTAYIGFDATASSLHVGSLIPLMILRRFVAQGHQAIIIMGGATTLIGDPSGKDKTRPSIKKEEIQQNIENISKICRNFVPEVKIINNYTWFENIGHLNFLSRVGRYFSVNRMVKYEKIAERLKHNTHLSFLEFSYSLLQAYDFLYLYENFGCTLQFGGSDQWTNINAGRELVHKDRQKEVFGLTFPLLLNSQKKKMGKTHDGAIWLDKAKLKPYDFWQFWRNVQDEDVIKFLYMCTDLPSTEIEKVSLLKGESINKAKVLLADFVTKLTHGEEELKIIHNINNESVVNKVDINIDKSEINILELLLLSKLISSKSQAKKMILNKGVKLNTETVNDINHTIREREVSVLTVGKKQKVFFKLR